MFYADIMEFSCTLIVISLKRNYEICLDQKWPDFLRTKKITKALNHKHFALTDLEKIHCIQIVNCYGAPLNDRIQHIPGGPLWACTMTGMLGLVSWQECGMECSRYLPNVNTFLLPIRLKTHMTPHSTRRFLTVWSAKILNIHVLYYSHDLKEHYWQWVNVFCSF